MDWDLAYKDLVKKIVATLKATNGTAILKEFLDQTPNEHEDDDEFNYCQWDSTDRITLATITATYKKCKETLIDVIDDLTRYSYIEKCQAQYLK